MLLALMALKANNALPANVTASVLAAVESAYVNDVTNQFTGITTTWTFNTYQDNGNYFGLELLNLTTAIMKQNGIYPTLTW